MAEAGTETLIVPVHVYLIRNFLSGKLVTGHGRLSETMNDGNPHLRLRDVVAVDYSNPRLRYARTQAVVVKARILFICDRPAAGYQPAHGRFAVARDRQRVTVACGPFFIEGDAHVPPGGTIETRLVSVFLPYIALTDVRIASSVLPAFAEDAVLVNREQIDHILS
ncbi:MAG TPA: hypothetical protein VMU89_01300 [Thermomicrobiaceae bacterium]|nr:hypothetical protein [Thermomicrobiaceae bacterium]